MYPSNEDRELANKNVFGAREWMGVSLYME
jgi:hypothetical protein